MRPANSGRRIQREKRSLQVMIGIYCRDHHANQDASATALCDQCEELSRYAQQRLDNCVFGELKQPCNDCSVHCYSKRWRPLILEVIRYAEPRLALQHPLLGALRLLDKLRGR
jgi:hypothetical protein